MTTTAKSKRYKEIFEKVPSDPLDPSEAIKVLKETATAKFVERVELHVTTGADPRHADQQLRTVVALPNGTGKQVRVFAFVEGDNAMVAKEAGADYTMTDELLKKIEQGWADFDASVATSDVMPKIAKLGRYLGRKNLMPSPRAGSVVPSQNLPGAVTLAKKGRVEIRMDKTAVIHTTIGTVQFEEQSLLENLSVVYGAIINAKPEGVKGDFIRSATICSTMGVGIKLDLVKLANLARSS